ncbi:type I polyketide synthase [Fulvivirga sediminis]|uniref:Acyltransferase domain-containing protein n=1 Tax=Fulvivirga sediminis TaxID=2803949 RepID=A0A937FBR4_9BACT|nr:type I polyketide synthase [Fulvivirga sediminis]MBL3658747.1 acyltransferase domain-containing protein [Fulvivirga sediminis]
MSSIINENGLEIAVIGMAGRFPKSANLKEFWENLTKGVEGITFFDGKKPSQDYVPAYGVLADKEAFDPEFFGYSKREAEVMDPQMRVMHEEVWRGLEDAGYTPGLHREKTGLFLCGSANPFWEYLFFNSPQYDVYGSFAGSQLVDKDYIATRISYNLNLTGPSITLSSACSSSLVAIHMAAQSLLNGECDIAIAGGVSITNYKNEGYVYQEGMISSPDGHCKPFSHDAQGTVGGEGAGVVVLRRYADAVESKDNIHAVIKGSAVNNDGNDKIGYTAPSISGQSECIRTAHQMSEISPESISFVEAHGTATELGDPIELEALQKAFGQVSVDYKCPISSVKSNFGHLDAAAGVTGFIKAVLSLRNKVLPPSLHFEQPNPALKIENTNFYVNNRLLPLEANDSPLRAGVSSFGIGGTNAHVVLEQYMEEVTSADNNEGFYVLPISAKSPDSLQQLEQSIASFLQEDGAPSLENLAFTLQQKREKFGHRAVYSGNGKNAVKQNMLGGNFIAKEEAVRDAKVTFMFPGQGSQYINMAHDLFMKDEVFRQKLIASFSVLESYLGTDVKNIILGTTEEDASKLKETCYLQPILFCIEYHVAQKLMGYGVKPSYMIGHSLGEYVAACISGVFTFEDALKVVVERGKAMQAAQAGSMLSVLMPENVAETYTNDLINIAAVNTPSQVVFTGDDEAIEQLNLKLQTEGYEGRKLAVSHSFHSYMMEEVKDSFLSAFENLKLETPKIPFISNVTGDIIKNEEAVSPAYWWKQLRNKVSFASGVQKLLTLDNPVFVEIGPGNTLSGFAKKCGATRIVPTMRSSSFNVDDYEYFMQSLGKLWVHGIDVKWGVAPGASVTSLPAYPFDKTQFDYKNLLPKEQNLQSKSVMKTSSRGEIRDWLYAPTWKLSPKLRKGYMPDRVLIFADGHYGAQRSILEVFKKHSSNVVQVRFGDSNDFSNPEDITIDPSKDTSFTELIKFLQANHAIPESIIYARGLGEMGEFDPSKGEEIFGQSMQLGFLNLSKLAQALTPLKRPFKLTVLGNQAFSILSKDEINPFTSLFYGPAKLIEIEADHIQTQLIDVQIENELVADLDAIISEVNNDSFHPAVAFRMGDRWVPSFNKLSQSLAERTPDELIKKDGVYVMIGGLGGIGLEMAKYFGQGENTKLILTGKNPLPAREDWQSILDDKLPIRENKELKGLSTDAQSVIAKGERELEQDLGILKIEEQGTVLHDLNGFCASNTMAYLQRKADLNIGDFIDAEALRKSLNTEPKYDKLIGYLFYLLESEEWISVQDGQVQIHRLSKGDEQELLSEFVERHKTFAGLFELVYECTKAYDEILTGKKEPVSFLYKESPQGIIADKMQNIPAITDDELYLKLCSDLLLPELFKTLPQNRKLRILEVGAGSGALTSHILPLLDSEKVEYYFTDVAKANLIKAETEAVKRGIDFINYQVLDIASDPVAQGFAEDSFDIMLGYNVVHVPKHVSGALDNLKSLLRPGGYLGLVESTNIYSWTNLIWGLVEGWLEFEDDRVENHSPLMTAQQWQDKLLACQYKNVVSFPGVNSERNTSLIIAQKDIQSQSIANYDEKLKHRLRKLIDLEAKGISYELAYFDISDKQSVQQQMQYFYNKYGRMDGVMQMAATPDDCTLQNVNESLAYKLLSPKIKGAINLVEALEDIPVDFVMLSSALTSFVSAVGQVHYCTSNLFVDAFAHYAHRSNPSKKIMAVNWDRWESIGLAIEVEKHHKRVTDEDLIGGFTGEEGLKSLNYLLQVIEQPQVVISTQMDVDYLSRLVIMDRSIKDKQESETKSHDKQEIREVIREEFNKFMDVDSNPGSNFFEIGLTSLDIVMINGKIKKRLDLDVQITDYYTYPTITLFIDHFTADDTDQSEGIEEKKSAKEVNSKLMMLRKRKSKSDL